MIKYSIKTLQNIKLNKRSLKINIRESLRLQLLQKLPRDPTSKLWKRLELNLSNSSK